MASLLVEVKRDKQEPMSLGIVKFGNALQVSSKSVDWQIILESSNLLFKETFLPCSAMFERKKSRVPSSHIMSLGTL